MIAILNNVFEIVAYIAVAGLIAAIVNVVEVIINFFPLKEVEDKPLPPKYIVKELTNHD